MDFLWDKITEWLKEMLIGGIVSNLSGMFDATNQKVAEISGQVGLSPQAWNGSIFSMIQNLSETVIVPIAGAILAFVMTLELIQLITDKNNLNDMDTWIFFKWAFKSAAAVLIVTNTWTIVMGGFDAAQSVVASASGLIIGDTSINISSVMVGIEDRLMEMELVVVSAAERQLLLQFIVTPTDGSYQVCHPGISDGLVVDREWLGAYAPFIAILVRIICYNMFHFFEC